MRVGHGGTRVLDSISSRLRARSAVGPVLLALAVAAEAQSAGWPGWRGPRGDGVSLEEGWSAVGQPEELWAAEVGLGYSSPSILDGRLYTCLLYTSPSPRDLSTSRMPSSA